MCCSFIYFAGVGRSGGGCSAHASVSRFARLLLERLRAIQMAP